MPSQENTRTLVALALFLIFTGAILCPRPSLATDDAVRDELAKKDCKRGKFNDYYLQGRGGDPAGDYTGRVFKLSQDYPSQLSPMEKYPWLKINFKNGGPVDPEAYLRALLDYGLEGNVEVDFYVEDNKIRKWYGMPWMDWNTEVVSDWPGTDGREFVDTWSGAYLNDRAAFGIGQVYCNPDDPKPGALNPDPTGLNNMADGSYVIKLLFSTVTEKQLPIAKNALEWQAHVFVNDNPKWRNKGPISRFKRAISPIRLIQIDVAVRDDRSITGWLLGTFGYDGNAKGNSPWERMVPLGLQWGNSPRVAFVETCAGPNGPCSQKKLTEQWINEQAVRDLATLPLNFDHLGYGGRLAGPVDNAKASCMGCHQTAGFPTVPILPEFSANGSLLKLDAGIRPETEQSLRMMYQGNVASGVVFSDTQLYSSDYSLQLSMSLQNFVSLRCVERPQEASAPRPALCEQLGLWSKAQIKSVSDILTFGAPGPDGGPIPSEADK